MNKNILITIAFLVLFAGNLFSQNQNVSINNTGSLPDASAMLDVMSTDRGILIPRMNSAQRQAIVAPATGLLVYDNSLDGFWYFDGIQWVAIGSGSGSGGSITDFLWTDATDLLSITEDGTNWDVTIDNEADDLTDNFINDLSNVNTSPTGTGQVLKWDGTQWYAGTDEAGAGGTVITAFQWTDATNLLRITEGSTTWDVTLDNEADDLSDNIINDLSNVNASPSVDDFLQWNGSAWIAGTASSGSCVTLDEAYDCGGSGAGRIITADAGYVEINSNSESRTLLVTNAGNLTYAVKSEHSNNGVAISGKSTNTSNDYPTIQAETNSNNNLVSAITGSSSGAASGVSGQIEVGASGEYAVWGNNLRTDESGSINPTGVFGQTGSGSGYGVYGENASTGTSYNNIGVAGWGWVGVFGQTSGGGFGVYSDGELGASGTKSFVIDHPLDPENKILKHFCAESPEVLNIYRGNIILNSSGEAVIELPDYFQEINTNFSYYLSPIGKPAPELHIKTEVKGNVFEIAGGKPNQKISWVLYAERNDLYIQKYPDAKVVEIMKRQKGKYIRPELFDKPQESGMLYRKSNLNKNYKQNLLKN